MADSKIRKYRKGDISVVWNAKMCEHSGICIRGLPEVFDVNARPWITVEGATRSEIIEQVSKCPSGALTVEYHTEDYIEEGPQVKVEIRPRGPLRIRGNFTIVYPNGREEAKTIASFCRCGHSSNKPFCDGTHRAVNFED